MKRTGDVELQSSQHRLSEKVKNKPLSRVMHVRLSQEYIYHSARAHIINPESDACVCVFVVFNNPACLLSVATAKQ